MDDRVWLETAMPPVIGKETKMITGKTVKPALCVDVGFFYSFPFSFPERSIKYPQGKGGSILQANRLRCFSINGSI